MVLDRPPRNFYRVSPTDEKYRLILTPNNVIDYPPNPTRFQNAKLRKKTAQRCGFLNEWCRLAELNCPLILTMDVYYHYTKAATAFLF